jgi:DNA-binding winged helix-turn-helix (wHTH) protein
MTVAPSTYRFGPFTVESTAYRLLKNGAVVQVSPKVIDLLLYLVARP